jgi:hypothetical protein
MGLSLEADGLAGLSLSAPFRKFIQPVAKATKP